MPHKTEDFIGAWTLVDWRIEYENGKITRPFGEGAIGYIVYAASGVMTASIARGEREHFNQANARHANDAQKTKAFDSYFHYAGRWSIEGEHVQHDVSLALNPDMVGSVQIRRAEFDGTGGLVLSAHEAFSGGQSRHHILQWKRDSL